MSEETAVQDPEPTTTAEAVDGPADGGSTTEVAADGTTGTEASAEASTEASTEDGDEAEGGSTLENEGEIAADYLEELLDIADFDGDIDTYVESNRAHVSVLTEGDVLVGSNGQVLEALQELSRLAVMTETGNRSRLMLDVGGYRDRRRKVLVALATDAVQDVKSSHESVRLEPMNPFERKIIHDVVAAGGLTSESEGEEPGRRVVILPTA